MAVTGPLATAEHAASVTAACLPLPPTYGLLINLSAVTVLTDAGLHGLRELAKTAAAAGHRVAFVCSELIMRAELVLSDLDLFAPVLQADEQAFPLIGYAA